MYADLTRLAEGASFHHTVVSAVTRSDTDCIAPDASRIAVHRRIVGKGIGMAASRPSRRTWIATAIPLLALILIGVLLVAVRSGNQPAPANTPVDAASQPTAPAPTSQPTAPAPTAAAPDEAASADAPIANAPPTPVAAEEIVAVVGEVVLTLDDLDEAAAIDAVMAGLAGQPPTAAATLVEQLINTEVVLARSGALAAGQDAAAALEGFLATHAHSYDDLATALATAGVTQPRFDRYFARLVSADAYQRRQQVVTGLNAASLLWTWQQEARISFGPIANSILGAVQAPAPATTEAAVAEPVAAVALADPTAAPAEEPIATKQAGTEQAGNSVVIDPNEPRGVEVGQLAPEFSLPQFTEESELVSLRNFLGEPSVLIFWTTWCPYCLRQTPALVEAHRQWGEQGIQFAGINVKEDASAVAPYVQQHGIEYPVLLDADGATAAAYAVQGYPTTYFLDEDNRIVARHVGALTAEQLRDGKRITSPKR